MRAHAGGKVDAWANTIIWGQNTIVTKTGYRFFTCVLQWVSPTRPLHSYSRRLAPVTEGRVTMEAFEAEAVLDAAELAASAFGASLLAVIGAAYCSAAEKFIGSSNSSPSFPVLVQLACLGCFEVPHHGVTASRRSA